jgi:hypothetical protein
MTDYVLLWSKSQNSLHIESVDSWLSKNRTAYANDSKLADYHPIVIGQKELCQQTADAVRNTIKDREQHREMNVI